MTVAKSTSRAARQVSVTGRREAKKRVRAQVTAVVIYLSCVHGVWVNRRVLMICSIEWRKVVIAEVSSRKREMVLPT
jgi:hypothetical protein